MFEIYAFCRAVDDIADDPGPRDAPARALQQWRSDIDAVYAGAPPPHLAGLAQAVRAFDLQREDFLAVIDGMEMDVVADIRAPDRATLDLYCDRVACAVGRLSVRVFGMEQRAGLALAHHLGRALQLTNILRDLDEDAALGRLYLPREALQAAGITATDPAAVLAHPALGKACARNRRSRARAEFRKARSDHGAKPAARRARAAHDGRGLSADSRPADRARLCAAARAGPAAARRLRSHRAAQSAVMAPHRPRHRRRSCRLVGCGEAGDRGRARRGARGAAFAGGRCRSYHDATLGMTIDNGNHLLLSGNHAALDYLRDIGAERSSDRAAALRNFPSSI